MPGWHAKTKNLVAKGQLQVFGIAPEQYGDRMALFLQWKELDFPVLMDPLNVLGVKAVPITLLVDEHGIIRYRNPKRTDLATFLETSYQQDKKEQHREPKPFEKETLAALHTNEKKKIADAIALLALNDFSAKNPESSFHAGVLSRHLFDHHEDTEAFQLAVDFWSEALKQIPSQYIWRRRIQQYGPRLDKPYPFYNWVTAARKEILARGGEPTQLRIEPSGSEVALPQKNNEQIKDTQTYPDLANQLPNDTASLVITTTLIPHTDNRDKGRLHLQLTPTKDSHWSSDAQQLELWLQPSEGDALFLSDQATLLQPNQETSADSRTLEADVSRQLLQSGTLILFSYLCDSEDATCRFLKTEWKMK